MIYINFCSWAVAVAGAHAVGAASSLASALVVAGAGVRAIPVCELINFAFFRRSHLVVRAVGCALALAVRVAVPVALAVERVSAFVGSPGVELLIDRALVLLLFLLIILAIGVADAIPEPFAANSFTFALGVI